ncbi:MAG: response regulator [Bacteroidia bacterium]
MSEKDFPSVLIVDDEEHSALLITALIRKHFQKVEHIQAVKTISEALQFINQNKVDILFLDIELRGESGFGLLDKIRERNFEFICLSASKEYAFKVFGYGGAGYLLKPVNADELRIVLNRVLAKRVSV